MATASGRDATRVATCLGSKKLSYRRETARQLRKFFGSLTDRAIHWTPQLLHNYTLSGKKEATVFLSIDLTFNKIDTVS